MDSIYVLLLGLLIFAIPSLSQKQGSDSVTPSWYISNPNVYAFVGKNVTRTGASIYLFRSGRRSFTSWKIYDFIRCSYDPRQPETPLKDGWMGCQEHLDAPEGEKQLSPDLYERLKWRLVDFKFDNVTSKFETATIQVVNALPAMVVKITELNSKPSYKIKTYSANFTITSDMVTCSQLGLSNTPEQLPGSISCSTGEKAGCKCDNRPGYIDPSVCNAACNFFNTTVVEQFHQSDDFNKLYWNLDTSPTKSPLPDMCHLGIRNCLNTIDFEGIPLN